ncbi:MAG: crossover junction endodeoxyribonuclease RuvC [Parcubacteria group bacterium Greene0416_79]|nr:MAG: crossover junction endodeoxyribonuclease RuvC [Parcubacteria group bacterium Greene0416_79]
MRVLAIDPGYQRLGIAVLEKLLKQKETLIFSSCMTTERNMPHANRLARVASGIRSLIETHKPEALAIEKLFLATNQKTAMAVAEARGAILAEAARAGLAVYEYTPLQIKMAVTGYGRSDKRQITEMVKRLIAVPPGRRLDDEYDAIAVGLTCLASERL